MSYINAKEELLKAICDNRIMCAEIFCRTRFDEYQKVARLTVGYDQNDFENFLKTLDFEYDNGYGWQELYGTVWVTDPVTGQTHWLERGEYDGSEWWELKTMPAIPEDLM